MDDEYLSQSRRFARCTSWLGSSKILGGFLKIMFVIAPGSGFPPLVFTLLLQKEDSSVPRMYAVVQHR